jgi:hypothetical protein
MSVRRFGKFLLGLLIAVIALPLVLPHVGVPQTRFLPPPVIYQQAKGLISAEVTNAYYSPTNDPFNVGGRLYFIDYRFTGPAVDNPPGSKKTQEYTGTVRVTQDQYKHFVPPSINDPNYYAGDTTPELKYVTVRYEKTYPWVNGVDDPPIGIGCGEGSNILSGWLIWVGAAIVLGYILMAIIDQFTGKEDI